VAAPAVDFTQVQGYLDYFPLGAHVQFPLEREQDWVRRGPCTESLVRRSWGPEALERICKVHAKEPGPQPAVWVAP
jgi:hypothetical protein